MSVTGSDTVIGNLNPFRYRGYYYDDETGLYYLQSRYYDPEVGRFINADAAHYIGITESVVSNNAFAYCENDPVNSFDPSGEKSYVNIPSFKSENWEYIINKSINLYEGSKIYKKLFTTIMVRDRYGRIRNVKVPLFLCKSADIYKKTGILFLNYFNSTQNNSKYRVTLGCMTVDNWNAYIVGKHKLALMKIKRKILKELNISSDKFDRAVEVAKDFYERVLDGNKLLIGVAVLGVISIIVYQLCYKM
ncbi:MAG: RHS repeat-associated core domain-containing protein, partial [Clostridia bacterium]|nr:RHS repeat-associated core domain-containing protein [Clostridia bacterium]